LLDGSLGLSSTVRSGTASTQGAPDCHCLISKNSVVFFFESCSFSVSLFAGETPPKIEKAGSFANPDSQEQ